MKTALTLFLIATVCFVLAGCESTAAVAPGAIAAIAASAMGIVQAVAPLMTPEQAANLSVIAGNIDGTIEATRTAVEVIASTFTQFQEVVGARAAETANGLSDLAQGLGEVPTRTEVQLTAGGYGTASLGGGRMLSHFKHTPSTP